MSGIVARVVWGAALMRIYWSGAYWRHYSENFTGDDGPPWPPRAWWLVYGIYRGIGAVADARVPPLHQTWQYLRDGEWPRRA